MSEPSALAYRELRARVCELVDGTDPAALERTVPATPEWRAHDLLSHLVGVATDVVQGRIEGVATNAWTQAQVDGRNVASIPDLVAEWDEFGPQFEVMIGNGPDELFGQAIFDAATHEHDLRNAIDAPGARDSEAVCRGWQWIVDARTRGGAPAISFVVETGEQVWGSGDLIARIEAPRFELFRAVSGRRTAAEIAAYGWDRPPNPSILIAADFFSIPEHSIGE